MADEKRSSESDSESEEGEKRRVAVKRKLESFQKLANDYEAEQQKKSKQTKLSDFVVKSVKGTTASTSLNATVGNCCWKDPEPNLHVYESAGLKSSSKVAGFDLDGTIICTKSGRVFPTDENDWQIIFAEVPRKLKQLIADGFKLVLFTNQKGIQLGHVQLKDFKKKIEIIQSKLGVPLQAMVSSGDGTYRKPLPGMWELLENSANDGVQIDRSTSFYVGDAAGRYNGKPKDHSCADRLFAANLGLKFYTPEEFFLGKKPVEYVLPEFDPKLLFKGSEKPMLEPVGVRLIEEAPELIVMVGYPASGKSKFVKQNLEANGYVVVNQDQLKTWRKCVSECEGALKESKSVVIDNTNPNKESRTRYINVAKKLNIPCRCFIMNVSYGHALHNNKFRLVNEDFDKVHAKVNEMVLNNYRVKYQEPAVDEGFQEIVKVNFVPQFSNETLKQKYALYLTEK